jgi:PAS domain S-box-containing protein
LEPLPEDLPAENRELRARLFEAEEALRAIREGEVDAIIVSGSKGDRVFSLTETENLHRLMVETMNEAGLALSADGLLLYANDRAAALLGRGRSELLGHRIEALVAPADIPRLRRLLESSHAGTADDRIVFRSASGADVPMHLWANRLPRPGETLICLVGTDLTRIEADQALLAELREHQAALKASRAEALKLMDEALLAREEAAQLAHELRDADRRKDAFLATLAHELRNPLAPIRNALDGIALDSREPKVLTALAVVDRQFSHLVRLLDDLLDVSRITCGKIDLRCEPVELSAVLATAVETVQPLIEAAGQRLTITPAARPIWLEADPIRLEQTFANLLNNATKYTGAGGEIRLAVAAQPGGVQVAVCDTGLGIRADLLPHVFDLFRRETRDQAHEKGGLGIGLSLVKRLTELHGGRVEVHSAGPGRGSEFRVFLPALPAPPKHLPAARGGRRRRLPRPPAASRILVVDDNRDAANSLAGLLAREGGEVEIAFDGPAALERFAARQPDLVILDIGMPGMDGHEVARRIRARADVPQPTLIAMSGLGQEADRRRSLAAGFDYHLVKPVPLDVLDALLSARWGAGASAGAAQAAEQQHGRFPRLGVPHAAPATMPAERAAPTPESGLATAAAAARTDAVATADLSAGDRHGPDETPTALLHELAQPLNTIACYAVAARNFAAKSAADLTPLANALRGIDQQILRAAATMDRLRALFRERDGGGTPRPEDTAQAPEHAEERR